MQIENAFTVPAPIDHVWAYLLDVERVAQAWELESWRRGGIGRAAARLKGAQTRR